MNRRRLVSGALVGMCSVVIGEGLVAADPPPSPAKPQTPWSAFEKLGRGVGNVATGWLEIPATLYRGWNPHDTVTSVFGGLIIGTAKGILRTGVGVFEVLTFPFPIPQHYEPIVPPLSYTWHGGGEWRKPISTW